MNLPKVEELTADEFAGHPLADDHIVACQANLVHDKGGCWIGLVEEDDDERFTSRMRYQTVFVVTVRHGRQLLACEDCTGALEDHTAAVGTPHDRMDKVYFTQTSDPLPVPDCDFNSVHPAGMAPAGDRQYLGDYGLHCPDLRSVCQSCMEHVVADLNVMGWPTVVETVVPDGSIGPTGFINRMAEITGGKVSV